jgi:tetratricopeptide (TPR) repeat protein
MKRISVSLLVVFLLLGATSVFASGGKEKSGTSKATDSTALAAASVQKGITAINAEKFGEAVADFGQAINLDQNNVTAYIGRVYASYMGGIGITSDEGNEDLGKVISLNNDFQKSFADFAALITLSGEARGVLDTLEENLKSMAASPPSDHDMYMQMEEK